MTANDDAIQSNVIFGGSRPRTEKQMAPLKSWGHSALGCPIFWNFSKLQWETPHLYVFLDAEYDERI